MYDRLCLIDLSVTADHLIRAEDLLPASTDKLLAADLVLFRTGFEAHRDDQERWANHNPGFASECARALEETAPRARAVGVDGPSAAAARHLEEGGEFHRRWLSGNLATPLRLIYEDLRLAGIEDRRIDRVIALPLRLVHADGAPCTVIAVCMNQIQVQRVLGARNLDHGRWGALFAGALKLTLLFIIILPATAAVVLYPNLDNPDQIWPILAFDLLPVGLWGGGYLRPWSPRSSPP